MYTKERRLQNKFNEVFPRLKILKDDKEKFILGLNMIHQNHPETYHHSLDVLLKGIEIAEVAGLDINDFAYGATLHDIGKIVLPLRILDKKYNFSRRDMAEMRHHPVYSYNILRGMFDNPLPKEVALRHHKYQKISEPYPKITKDQIKDYSKEELNKFEECAKILSISDVYNAFSRSNNRNGNKPLTPIKKRDLLIEDKSFAEDLIRELYKEKIFR